MRIQLISEFSCREACRCELCS